MGGEDDKTYSNMNLCSLTAYFGREIQATNKLSLTKVSFMNLRSYHGNIKDIILK
jgi:hypothetical protein